ncbi:hypothetical protein E4U51_002168 [Claviceps purpurea]|nr:hypothetical protein E4U51_002168 [Claviceps purpurea]
MDDQPLQLPYFATQSRLPIPIPSVQDIEREAHFVIKYGPNVSLTEGENMLFVRHTQPLLAPEVFALFSVENTDCGRVNYIIMENVVGDGLDQVWATLDTPEKRRTAGELRLQIETLRKIPAPGYFGCLGRRPFEEKMFWTAPGDVLRGHGVVSTHGDLQQKNVMLKPDGQPVLIDWETAGWYQAYWEYASAMVGCRRFDNDWHEYIPRIMEEYPGEYVWHAKLRDPGRYTRYMVRYMVLNVRGSSTRHR